MRRTAERDEESRVASSDMLDAAFRLPDRGADPLGMRDVSGGDDSNSNALEYRAALPRR